MTAQNKPMVNAIAYDSFEKRGEQPSLPEINELLTDRAHPSSEKDD